MARSIAALLVVPALLAAACGGGGNSARQASDPTPSPSITVPGLISASGAVPADYLTHVDAACASALALLRKRGPAPLSPADPRDLTAAQLKRAAAFLQRGADIQRDAAAAIGRLAPPPVGGGAWGRYRTAVAKYAAGAQDEAAAAKAGDVSRFLVAAARLLDLRTRASESGLAVGLGAGTACARLF